MNYLAMIVAGRTVTSIPVLDFHYLSTIGEEFSENHSHLLEVNSRNLIRSFIVSVRAIRSHRIIHTHHTFSAILVSAISLALGNRALLVHTVHRNFDSFGIAMRVVYRILVFPFRRVLVANSRSTLHSLPASARRKAILIYNGVETELVSACGRKSQRTQPNIINVGRLVAIKDQATLIRAAAELRKRGRDFTVTICGTGPERQNLEFLIRDLDLAQVVTLAGETSREHTYELISNADIGVVTSLNEGFGAATVEMLAAGLPLVASDIGINHEILDELVSYFPPGSVSALAMTLDSLVLRWPFSAATERDATAKRKAQAELFSMKSHIDQLRAMYAGLLE